MPSNLDYVTKLNLCQFRNILNFHPLEAVGRYRRVNCTTSQLQEQTLQSGWNMLVVLRGADGFCESNELSSYHFT